MWESLFEILFKYRPLVFREGDFAFTAPAPVTAIVGATVLLAAPALLSYAFARGRSGRADRFVLSGLRLGALAVLGFCLLRPALVLSTVIPQQTFLGVLVDDSRSMGIRDGGEEPRSAFVERHFGASDSPLLDELARQFELRFFRFSSGAGRISDVSELDYQGTRTRIGMALERARTELAGVPLAGLVVVTDGADNSQESLAETLLALKAGSVPVYTVGLGEERLERDVQLSRVETPRTVLQGASLVLDLVVAHNGYQGATVPLLVEDEGEVVSTQEVILSGDGAPTTVRVRFTAQNVGARRFRFRIPPQQGEAVTENNVQESLIVVRDAREKILYLEGEPRYEVKFLRRAVADDDNVQVVVLQRTAENKFLRLDVDDADELLGGFPRSRDELFTYRGLILGSVEASFFTHDQLQMIVDFVNRRGGGLLVLGGRRAFAQGGYVGTSVADVLPVVLDEPAGSEDRFIREIKVVPTRAGEAHPITQLAVDEETSALRWDMLPPLSSYNPVHDLKPGATALLTGTSEDLEREQVVLAWQRYGRGKAIVLPVWDTWLWQMHADVPLEDMSHETFWRQLLRWLVDGVPDRVVAETGSDRAEPGEPVVVTATVDDSTYLEVNDGSVAATVTSPSGQQVQVPLEWTVERDGEYQGTFVPAEEGTHEIRVEARRGEETLGSDATYVQAKPSDSEYFDAGMRGTLLRRIAEETGGRFYTPANVSSLPEDITYTGSGATVMEERDLWDMPVLLIVLVGLLAAEWLYRRKRELV